MKWDWLYELTYDELIEYIIQLWDDIFDLEDKLSESEEALRNKIAKDYEDNRKMVARIFNTFVQEKRR